MHELSLMEAVRDQSLAAANAEGATRITAISLRIGSLAGVEPEALRFAHTVVMAGTIAAGAELRIEIVIARFFCEPCQQAFDTEQGDCLCLRCGSFSRRLLQGRELELTSLELS
ncbi:hydrogenase maturation nickel metallochaperone HypA [Cyanobium sp. T1G-Tous]|uniref:hydrogenase maturation nickel metallochaperone HypA n=1 Tax=Cyanobium sp. T1G-Tous TaxID=2823722 RepID=UPI0020CDED62|nr:hydrogenase maturation nickel metallochaperone HypA [Cyanobium sp. T1G-Tous]MCP9803869.1 hydrogenase maturation nickel metallochaperone HypA [Cyanobium sp. T1G-Tous]